MWKHSGNGESVMPPSYSKSGNIVILRKNFKLIPAKEDFPEHYEWEEWQMTSEQYDIYKDFEMQVNEQSDALVELAELITEAI